MNKNKISGIGILIIAIIYLLNSFDLIENFNIFKIILLCYLIFNTAKGIYQKSISITIYSAGLSYYFGASYANLPHINSATLFVFTTLLVIGLNMILENNSQFNFFSTKDFYNNSKEKVNFNHVNNNLYDETSVININTILGDSNHYITSKNLELCNITCMLGDVKVYFDQADMTGNTAKLNIGCTLGEVYIYVPRDWEVQNSIAFLLSDINTIENMSDSQDEKFNKDITNINKILKITGSSTLGDIKIFKV